MAAARRRQVVKASRTASVNAFLGGGCTSAGTKASMPNENTDNARPSNGQTDEDELPRPHLQRGPEHKTPTTELDAAHPDPNTPRLSYPAERRGGSSGMSSINVATGRVFNRRQHRQ